MTLIKKGQAATEYLMTYGWALLAIVIVAAVLWNMGIFGGAGCTDSLSGFTGAQLYVDNAVVLADGSVNIHARNAAGSQIDILDNAGAWQSLAINADGTFNDVTTTNPLPSGVSGECFSGLDFRVTYNVSGLTKSASGKISGTLQ